MTNNIISNFTPPHVANGNMTGIGMDSQRQGGAHVSWASPCLFLEH